MVQAPFPFALVFLVALFGSAAFWAEPVWVKVLAVLGALIVAAAAVYQSMPKRSPEDPIDDELPQ